MVPKWPFNGIKFVQVQTYNNFGVKYLKLFFGVMKKVSSSSSSFIKIRKLTITKKGKPGKAETIGIEDVPDHAVDVVVVDGKIIKELRDVPEEGEEHVRKANGNHEGTGSLEGFTIDNVIYQICVHLSN